MMYIFNDILVPGIYHYSTVSVKIKVEHSRVQPVHSALTVRPVTSSNGVAVKLSYRSKETLSSTIYPYHGNLIQVSLQQPSEAQHEWKFAM